jgi:hypothetical protein
MWAPGNVGDLEVEAELPGDELVVDVPLVAGLVDGRIGGGRATEDGLKIHFKMNTFQNNDNRKIDD